MTAFFTILTDIIENLIFKIVSHGGPLKMGATLPQNIERHLWKGCFQTQWKHNKTKRVFEG